METKNGSKVSMLNFADNSLRFEKTAVEGRFLPLEAIISRLT